MQEQRPAQLDTELELRDEPFLLVGMRRVVAVEVQAAFAYRHNAGIFRDFPERIDGRGIAAARMVRVDSWGGVQAVLFRDAGRRGAFLHRRSGHHDLRHAGGSRASDVLVEIVAKSRVREVRAEVRQLRLHSFFRRYSSSRASRGERSSGFILPSSSRRGSTRGSSSTARVFENKSFWSPRVTLASSSSCRYFFAWRITAFG